MEIGLVIVGAIILLDGLILGVIITTLAWLQMLRYHGYRVNREWGISRRWTEEELRQFYDKHKQWDRSRNKNKFGVKFNIGDKIE